jgi:hypothetical protein
MAQHQIIPPSGPTKAMAAAMSSRWDQEVIIYTGVLNDGTADCADLWDRSSTKWDIETEAA